MSDEQMSKFFRAMATACDVASDTMSDGYDPETFTDVDNAMIDALDGLARGFAKASKEVLHVSVLNAINLQ